jgi:hypothetical protein
VALAHVEVRAAHRQREAHRRARRDAHTVPVDLGGPVGVGEVRTRLHHRDVSPLVCGKGRPACSEFVAGTPMAYPVRHRPVIKCHDDVVCISTISKIDDAIPRRACPRAVDPRGEREAKPPADDSGARSGRQVGVCVPGEGVCAGDDARRRGRRWLHRRCAKVEAPWGSGGRTRRRIHPAAASGLARGLNMSGVWLRVAVEAELPIVACHLRGGWRKPEAQQEQEE